MRFLANACLFIGYLLLYAATANHGRFALEPWQGVYTDAYTGEGQAGPAGSQGPVGV